MTVDSGFAPNPFGGVCSLATCKPIIRRCCKIGDLVFGFGSSELGHENKLIYAFKVDKILTFAEYDAFCNDHCRIKLPSVDPYHGDCIYYKDPRSGKIKQRENLFHTREEMKQDLEGEHVLLGEEFRFFGDNAKEIPEILRGIVPPGRGHQSKKNQDYASIAQEWIQTFAPGIHGRPNNEIGSIGSKRKCR